jgi:hypothetical protein
MSGTRKLGWAWVLIAFAAPSVAAPAPDLAGKSVMLTWTENRQQSVDGSKVHSARVDFDLRIYVSAKGRPFTRLTSTGRRGTGSNEQVGSSGQSLGGGVRSIHVDGHSITLQAVYGNYARNLRIEASGSGCSAHMTVGKQVGSAPTAFRHVKGITIEIHSVSASTPTCAVRAGNVFAR